MCGPGNERDLLGDEGESNSAGLPEAISGAVAVRSLCGRVDCEDVKGELGAKGLVVGAFVGEMGVEELKVDAEEVDLRT